MRKNLPFAIAIAIAGSLAVPASAMTPSPAMEQARNVLAQGAGSVYDGSAGRSAAPIDAGLTINGIYSNAASALRTAGAMETKNAKVPAARPGWYPESAAGTTGWMIGVLATSALAGWGTRALVIGLMDPVTALIMGAAAGLCLFIVCLAERSARNAK
jgi:hypothetical protein